LLMYLWLLSQWFEFFDLKVAFTLLLFGVLTVAFMSWNLVVRSGEAKRGCQCLLVPKPGEPAYIRSFFISVLCWVVLVSLVVVLALEATRSPMSHSAHVSRVLETCNAKQSMQNKLDPCWEARTVQQQQPADEEEEKLKAEKRREEEEQRQENLRKQQEAAEVEAKKAKELLRRNRSRLIDRELRIQVRTTRGRAPYSADKV